MSTPQQAQANIESTTQMLLSELLQAPETQEYRPLREVLAVIDGIHRVPAWAPLPIRLVAALQEESAGAYVTRAGRAARIEIARNAPFLELTMAHEVGHLLDHQGFGAAGAWASETAPQLDGLRQAWEGTEAVQALRQGVQRGRLQALLPHGQTVEIPLHADEIENCRYYLQGRELFARSYAQYVAHKSQNRVLSDQVRDRRDSVEGRLYRAQWPDTEFLAVTEAFDRLLEGEGWLR